jgi:hypothetical protein
MRIPRKAAIALLAGVCIAGIAGASAASLGPVTVGSLGAENSVVASCDTDGITINYTTTYSVANARFEVTSVTLGNVNTACGGKNASVVLAATGGTSLGSGSVTGLVLTGVVALTGGSVSIPIAPGADAKAVVAASVVISG